MTAEYNGTFRTQLTDGEKAQLKRLARANGMTLVGYHDEVIRKAMKNTENGSRHQSNDAE